jgi:predicted enzyme related to lactoylglutathione lyase
VLVSTEEVMWQMNDSAGIFIVEEEATERCANILLAADDLDDTIEVPAGRGITPREIELIEGAGRNAYFNDPDGNEVVLAEIYAG